MDALSINQKLIRLYGRCPQTNNPKYRVVRSETQTEKRTGSYKVFTESGIYLRDEFGTREIKKYWNIAPCWMLERFELNFNRTQLIDEKFTYEPLFPFLDKDNETLPLEWKPIEFIVNAIEKTTKVVKTEAELTAEEEKKIQEQEDQIFGILDAPESLNPLPSFKTSVFVSEAERILKSNIGKYNLGIQNV